MARNTVSEDLNTSINLGVPENPLLLPIADDFVVNLAGAQYYDYATSARVMADVWSNAIERFNLDWAGLLVDDLLQFDTLGMSISSGNPGLPFGVTKYLPANPGTLKTLRIPNPKKDGRMPIFLEAEKRLRDRWGKEILICGSSTAAPFSGLTLLYGVEQTMLLLYDNPVFLKKSLHFLEELAITWGRAMAESGADLIWLGDCSASSRFISLGVYREFCLEPAKRVIASLQSVGLKVIYFAGETKLSHLEVMSGCGADIIGVEAGVEMGAVKDSIGDRICIMGNLDALNLIWHGAPSEIERKIDNLVKEVAVRGGYVVNVGEGIPEQAPVVNVEAMVESVRGSWKKWVSAG